MVTFFTSPQTFVSIGPFHIQWYAVCILSGALITFFLSRKNTRKLHYPDELVSDFFVGALWIGILGARLWYCLFYDLAYFVEDPIRFLEFYKGGLAIHGGVIAGVLYALYFCKKHHISFLRFGDAILPNILIGQAIGRWGNFINQEAFGQEVSEHFFNGPLFFLKEGMNIAGKYYEPTFFYESFANVIGFLLIVGVLKKKQNKRGDLVWAYAMWYGLVRLFVEARRSDALMIGSLRIAQIISLIGIVIGLLGYLGMLERFFPRAKKTILFDLDGTLVDTEKTIIESYRHLFKNRQRENEFTKEKEISVIGPSLQAKLEEFFPGEDKIPLMIECRDYHDQILSSTSKPMPHVVEVLETLKKEGYSLGVVTARWHDSGMKVLKAFNLEKYFDVVIGKDQVKQGKPDPEGICLALNHMKSSRDEVVYVGDSDTDILAGKNYGAFTVGYYFNEHRKEDLEKANADYYFDDWRQFITILESDFLKNKL